MRNLSRVACVSLAAISISASPTVVAAQGNEPLRQPTSIPAELAAALASSGGFGRDADPQILVDAIPEWALARLYVPRGARVVGSAFLGTTLVAILDVPGASDTVLNEFEAALKKRNWTSPPPPNFGNQGGGFRPAPGSQLMAPTTTRVATVTLCGTDKQTVTAWVGRRRATDATVTLRLATATGFSSCFPPPRPPGYPDRDPMPTLYNPPSTTDIMNGNPAGCFDRANYGSSGTFTRLRGPISPSAILEHYATQLRDSGWTAKGADETEIKRTFTRSDSGRVVHLTLSVRAPRSDTSCNEVNMSLEDRRP